MLRKSAMQKRQYVMMALVLVCVLGLGGLVRAANFWDIDDPYARDEIICLADRGVIVGYEDGSFRPAGLATRGEYACMLAHNFNLAPNPEAAARFTDVPADSWYAGEIGVVVNVGIVAGTSGDSFSPNAPLTREEALVILFQAMGLTEYAKSLKLKAAFSDAGQVSTWAQDVVGLAEAVGFTVGIPNPDGTTRFGPRVMVDRQTLALWLCMAFKNRGAYLEQAQKLLANVHPEGVPGGEAIETPGVAVASPLVTRGSDDNPGPIAYQLTVNSAAHGTTVSPYTPGAYTRYAGDAVSITAVPDTGYQLNDWIIAGAYTGEARSGSTVSLVVRGNITIVPVFGAIPCSLIVDEVANGTTNLPYSPGAYDINYGTPVTIKAVPDPGYAVITWSVTGPVANRVETGNEVSFIIQGDVQIAPIFDIPPLIEATITALGDYDHSGLNVDGRDFCIEWTPSPSVGVTSQEIYILPVAIPINILTQTPAAIFGDNTTGSWTGPASLKKDGANDNLAGGDYVIYVVSKRAGGGAIQTGAPMTAVLEHELTISVDRASHGSAGITGISPWQTQITLSEGATASITATPNTGWSFSTWTLTPISTASVASATSATADFTMGDRDVTARASFEVKMCTVNVTINPPFAGTVSDGSGVFTAKQYVYSTPITLTPTSETGCQFTSWQVNGGLPQASPTLSLVVTDDTSVTANFDIAPPCRLFGTVYRNAGLPLPGVTVQLYVGTMPFGSPGLTDDSGGFNFAGLPPGTYNLEFTKPGYKTISYGGIVLTADQSLLVSMYPGGGNTKADLHGWVTVNGIYQNGINVTLTDGWGRVSTNSTHNNGGPGYYQFNNVTGLGNCTVTATDGIHSASATVWLWPGDNGQDLAITFPTLLSMRMMLIPTTYSLNVLVNDAKGGTTDVAGTTSLAEGETITITPTASQGWTFDGWTVEPPQTVYGVAAETGAINLTMGPVDITLTANFSQPVAFNPPDVTMPGGSTGTGGINGTTGGTDGTTGGIGGGNVGTDGSTSGSSEG